MNLTQRSSGYAMLRRYHELLLFLSQTFMQNITDFLLSPGQHRHVINLLGRFEKQIFVSKFLSGVQHNIA